MDWSRGPIIGRGATATVSLATALPSGELFAVKSAELSKSAFLQKEHQFLSQLSSPNVVKHIGFDIKMEDDRFVYNLFMEYVPGGTLRDEIFRRGGRMSEPAIGSVTKQVLTGLECLHKNGLVHCDVKSQNILMGSDGAKIADLGCARFEKDDNFSVSGTPVFMSPEAARGEAQGFEADVWAVGCTVIEMATGGLPWTEVADPVSALYRIGFSGDVPESPAWFSEEGIDFLSKCFKKDPKERWTVEELLSHPFLDEMEPISKDGYSNSPSCVLDRGFWDAVEASASFQGPVVSGECFAGRIEKLVSGDEAKWGWDDEDWVTVRSNEAYESDEDSSDEGVMASSAMEEEDVLSLVVDSDLFINYSFETFSSIVSTGRGFLKDDIVLTNSNYQINEEFWFLQSCLVLFRSYNFTFSTVTCNSDNTRRN